MVILFLVQTVRGFTMFESMGDYIFDSFEEFNEAYSVLVHNGEKMYSPGYFNRYGVSRQLLYTWAVRDLKIRRFIYTAEENKYDKFVFIPESDVIKALNNSKISQ